MPEIPEMETYRNMLDRTVVVKNITGAVVNRPRSINIAPEQFSAALVGQFIENVSRRAKYLVFQLRGGLYMVTHMMLDGRIYYGPSGIESGLPGKSHVILNFADNNSLYFCDLRLGYLHLLDQAGTNSELAGLGIEPLSADFTWETFMGIFRGRRGAIKPLLIEQKLIAGLGNAYSNEVLFAAGILPDRVVPSIAENEMRKLWQAIPRLLREAIQNGGYIEEPYASWDNLSGGQIPHFMVYDRSGEPCKVCGTTIQENKLGGRWAYYCVNCQR